MNSTSQDKNLQANIQPLPTPVVARLCSVVPEHPLAEEFKRVLAFKDQKEYPRADDICWRVLSNYGIKNNDSLYQGKLNDLVAQVPLEDAAIVAHFLYELALTNEVKKNDSMREGGDGDKFAARKIKLLFLATELNSGLPLAAARLAYEAVHMPSTQLARINYLIDLPKIFKASPEKSLNEFRESALERLINAFNSPPFELLEEHFHGELPLNEEWIVRGKLADNDPRILTITELTWVLTDCAKLSINIANYYRDFEPDQQALFQQYEDFTRMFAGTLLNVFDIPRDIAGATQAIQQNGGNYGKRKPNIVSVLTNLASIAEGENRDLARRWLGLALHLDPTNEYALGRLQAFDERPQSDWRRTQQLLNRLKAPSAKVTTTSQPEWEEVFQQNTVRYLHREIVDSINREPLVMRYSELQGIAFEFGKQARIMHAKNSAHAQSYLKHLEGNADAFWESAHEERGNFLVQSQLSQVQLLIERNLLPPSIHTKNVIEKLEEIRDSSRERLALPEVDEQHAFFRRVLDLIREDLRKRP